jgi:hypothetical protein
LRERSLRREAAVGARPTARLAPRGDFVSPLVRAGASVGEVQALAHHAKPETTLRSLVR